MAELAGTGRRVVVTGATGNIGRAVMARLRADGWDRVGIARRVPPGPTAVDAPPEEDAGTEWAALDVGVDALDRAMAGADAVVHLAWAIQPSHDRQVLFRTNVVGSEAVVRAAVRAGVRHVVHASSVGAYSPAPRGVVVDESWPTDGTPELDYSWQKAYVERVLDTVETAHPEVTVTRVRPALVFQRRSAPRVHDLFVGRHVPHQLGTLLATGIAAAPVGTQVVHAEDVADAIARILERRAAGAFNLAAEPRLGHERRGGHAVMRGLALGAALTWRARLLAAEPGWVRLAADAPTMSTARAHDVLGWQPTWTSHEVLGELRSGLAA